MNAEALIVGQKLGRPLDIRDDARLNADPFLAVAQDGNREQGAKEETA
jgi:hypothetical protein